VSFTKVIGQMVPRFVSWIEGWGGGGGGERGRKGAEPSMSMRIAFGGIVVGVLDWVLFV